MQLGHNNSNSPFCGVLFCGKVRKQLILTHIKVFLIDSFFKTRFKIKASNKRQCFDLI